ncbi:hypothetical protein FQN57_000138 [Myotisia sp. PD_48]|nr:hypothetical protein FQN57_000138 [Myotisia sp. PD_48]
MYTGLHSYWPYCNVARRMAAMALTKQDMSSWDTFQWKRRMERFGDHDEPIIATGPDSELEGICLPGELTDKGRQTTFALGQRLRHLYVDRLGFMPHILSNTENMYLRATPIPRALESLQETFWGMYPPSARTASFIPPVIVTRSPADETLFPNEGGCHRFRQLARLFAQRAADKWNDTEEMEYLNSLWSKWMPPDSPRVAVDSRPRLSGILDTINSTLAHGSQTRLPSEFYDVKAREIADRIAVDEWFTGSKASREYRKLAVGALMGDVVERMVHSVVNGGWKPMGASTSQNQAPSVKFALSGCHDTTIASILAGLGAFEGERWPPYTASIAVELFKDVSGPSSKSETQAGLVLEEFSSPPEQKPGQKASFFSIFTGQAPNGPSTKLARAPQATLPSLSNHYVRVRYNDRPVRIPGCAAKPTHHLHGDDTFCSLEAFKEIVDKYTPANWREECGTNLDKGMFPPATSVADTVAAPKLSLAGCQFKLASILRLNSFTSSSPSRTSIRRISSSSAVLARKFCPEPIYRPHDYWVFEKNRLSSYPLPQDSQLGPMKTFLQVISSPSSDTRGTTLLLHFDDQRYVFGHIAEGTQRACAEQAIRTSKLSNIFVTGKSSWDTNGGMLGLLLTHADTVISSGTAWIEAEKLKLLQMQEREKTLKHPKALLELQERIVKQKQNIVNYPALHAQARNLTIHGGPNLIHTLATARTFICRAGMCIGVNEFGAIHPPSETSDDVSATEFSKPSWSDSHLNLWALPLYPSNSNAQRTRKRSLDEFEEGNEVTGDDGSFQKAQIERLRVVSEMFNSKWRLDALIETPLAEVSSPALLFIRDPEDSEKVKPYDGPRPGDPEPLPDIKVLVRQPWPGALIESLPATTPSECAMSYIVRFHDSRGKFDPQKAKELQVKKGPDYRKLTLGESVTSIDGKTITPDMVMGESKHGKAFAVVDLPTPDYVENFVRRKEWESEYLMKNMTAFIWILGSGVANHPLLQEFVSKMAEYQHIVSSPDHCPNQLTFRGAAVSTIQLSDLVPSQYKIPVHDNTPQSPSTSISPNSNELRALPAQPNLLLNFEPEFSISSDELKTPIMLNSLIGKDSPTKNFAQQLRKQFLTPQFKDRAESFLQRVPNHNAEIITLGTGSSIPSRFRNVSATLVRVPGHGNYLLDAGEGTLGQLKRTFKPDELTEILRDLKVIWISHLHADHHLGTVSVVKAWYETVFGTVPPKTHFESIEEDVETMLSEKRLYVISSKHMIDWMAEYACVENFGYDKVVPLAASSFEQANSSTDHFYTIHRRGRNGRVLLDSRGNPIGTTLRFEEDTKYTQLLKAGTGLDAMLTTPVSHCVGAKAVSLVFPDGFKVSYSGDCRPDTRFVEIGRGSTVLIHEATFDDDMISDAVAKRHSTVSEAVTIGRKMEAEVIILTHFSQRYRAVADVENVRDVRIEKAAPWSDNRDRKNHNRRVGSKVRDIPVDDGEFTPFRGGKPVRLVHSPVRRSSQQKYNAPILVAFDHMRLRVSDACYAEVLQPAIKHHLQVSTALEDDEPPATGASV